MGDKEKAEIQLPNPEIRIEKFDQLTPYQVAYIYALRYNVFVREQQSIYDEHDGKDFEATHLLIEDGGKVVGYARICPENDTTVSIGRVAVDSRYRGQDLGRKIVAAAINKVKQMPGIDAIKIGAQVYLQRFYESFGFETTSEPYDEDGVWHRQMELKLGKN